MKKMFFIIAGIVLLCGNALCQETENAGEKQWLHVGGLYTFDDGSRGVIFYLDGEHGLAVSLKGTKEKWCSGKYARKDIPDVPNACDAYPDVSQLGEGAANSQKISNWTFSPAVAWCNSLGEGWYLPSAYELCYLFNKANKQDIHGGIISKGIKANGGTKLAKGWYWSSTECGKKDVVNVDEDGDTATELKKVKNLVRAVRAF